MSSTRRYCDKSRVSHQQRQCRESPPSLTALSTQFVLVSIRDAAGPSVKSSISHTFVRDTRDDPFLPSRGSFLKVQHVRQSLRIRDAYSCDDGVRNTLDWEEMQTLFDPMSRLLCLDLSEVDT
jgi:hypothetical protein